MNSTWVNLRLFHRPAVGFPAQLQRSFHTTQPSRIVHRKSHYTVLGVPTSATQKEIKSAFYKQSMQWHPDRNQGSDEAHKQFLKINEAYSVLGTEQSRTAYDRSMRINSGPHTSAPYRYHNSGFSASGEYSSAKRSEFRSAYQRPAGTYTSAGYRTKSNFAEWERKHYEETQKSADHIRRTATNPKRKWKYSNAQVVIIQFWEMCLTFAAVFGIGWAGSHLLPSAQKNKSSTNRHSDREG